jgi:hypothetical protein
VVEPVDPQVLVVADERRLVLRDDPAVPARDDELGVRDVAQALEHGPLVGLGAFGDAGAGAPDHLAPGLGGSAWTSAGSSSPTRPVR